MGIMVAQAARMMLDNEFLERPSTVHKACGSPQSWEVKASTGPQFAGCPFQHAAVHGLSRRKRREQWSVAFALDTGGATDGGGGGQESLGGESSGLGRTRLGTIVRAAANQLLEKLNSARKNVPTKIFLLLLGFYTANALATILGQTGDWDVLVAGIVVAAVEGIGMVVYRRSPSMMRRAGRLRALVEMVNYWKAGVCLGLFVDAFKLGS